MPCDSAAFAKKNQNQAKKGDICWDQGAEPRPDTAAGFPVSAAPTEAPGCAEPRCRARVSPRTGMW